MLISYLFGVVLSFPFYKEHTFHSKEEIKKAMSIYFLINIIALIFSLLIFYLIVEKFKTNVLLTYLFVLSMTTLIKFLGFKILAFNNKEW